MDHSRQVLLDFVGKAGQEKLKVSCIAIVGVGGVGCVSSQLLALAGIGKLVLVDRDVVESSNLYRQPLFSERDIGRPKAEAARDSLLRLSPEVEVVSFCEDLGFRNVAELLRGADVVLDCTDNMEARFLINEHCRKYVVPWVYSASVKSSGTVMAFLPSGPCFRCVFTDSFADKGHGQAFDTCDVVGAANFATSATACFQVSECLKIVLGNEVSETGTSMLRFDLWGSGFEKISAGKSPGCPVCSGVYDYLSGRKGAKAARLCGTGKYQVRGRVSLDSLRKSLSGSGFRDFGSCISLGDVTVFAGGRALVKASSESEARSKYSKVVG